MKIAECHCAMCDREFKINFDGDKLFPDYIYVVCPSCGSKECKVVKVDIDD